MAFLFFFKQRFLNNEVFFNTVQQANFLGFVFFLFSLASDISWDFLGVHQIKFSTFKDISNTTLNAIYSLGISVILANV